MKYSTDNSPSVESETSTNQHGGKYFVIQKGMAQCNKGFTFPKFKVTSHTKHYWNSPDADSDYLAVTEDDLTFDPVAQPFGQCKLKPSSGGYLPCVYAPAGKWTKTYEEVKVMGTVVFVSGSDKKNEKDPTQNIFWIMYKTTVYQNITLDTFKKLKSENRLPSPDYITYLSRDTHQTVSRTGTIYKHSDKRFGQYNEIPPGEYFLVPGLATQKYLLYVIDSEAKSADDLKAINGIDGDRGGVALHHYCPRFSVGCFTFNSGNDTTPVQDFIKQIPDLKLGDNRPVIFIVESRQVRETVWNNPAYGTKKWFGI